MKSKQLYSVLAMTGVLSLSVMPYLEDLGRHCILHTAVPHVTSPEGAANEHGLHHDDCHWLLGNGQIRAVILTPPALNVLRETRLYITPAFVVATTALPHALRSRSPPAAFL